MQWSLNVYIKITVKRYFLSNLVIIFVQTIKAVRAVK